jgi:hypothetical protein
VGINVPYLLADAWTEQDDEGVMMLNALQKT